MKDRLLNKNTDDIDTENHGESQLSTLEGLATEVQLHIWSFFNSPTDLLPLRAASKTLNASVEFSKNLPIRPTEMMAKLLMAEMYMCIHNYKKEQEDTEKRKYYFSPVLGPLSLDEPLEYCVFSKRVIDKIKEQAPLEAVFDYILSSFRAGKFNLLDAGVFHQNIFSFAIASLDSRIIDKLFSSLTDEKDQAQLKNLYEFTPPYHNEFTNQEIRNFDTRKEDFSSYFDKRRIQIFSQAFGQIDNILSRAAEKQGPLPSRKFMDRLMKHLPNDESSLGWRKRIVKDYHNEEKARSSTETPNKTQNKNNSQQGLSYYMAQLLLAEIYTDQKRDGAETRRYYSPVLGAYYRGEDGNNSEHIQNFSTSFYYKAIMEKLKKEVSLIKICEHLFRHPTLGPKILLYCRNTWHDNLLQYLLRSFDPEVTKLIFTNTKMSDDYVLDCFNDFVDLFQDFSESVGSNSILSLKLLNVYADFFSLESNKKILVSNNASQYLVPHFSPIIKLYEEKKDPGYLEVLAFIYFKLIRPFEDAAEYKKNLETLRKQLSNIDNIADTHPIFSLPIEFQIITSQKKKFILDKMDYLGPNMKATIQPVFMNFLPSDTLTLFNDYYAHYEDQEKDEEQALTPRAVRN